MVHRFIHSMIYTLKVHYKTTQQVIGNDLKVAVRIDYTPVVRSDSVLFATFWYLPYGQIGMNDCYLV